MKTRQYLIILSVLIIYSLSSLAFAQDATIPGEINTPYPTLENLSVEWAIQGDDNLNGVVTVRYRRVGDSEWRPGLSLSRIPSGSNVGFSWINKHSGSVMDLTPDTLYEIELTLIDPDGGNETRTVEVRTRPIPVAAPDATIKSVTTYTFTSIALSSEPGDIIELENGTYSGFTFPNDGTIQEPIVIRAKNFKKAVFEGDVRLDSRSYVYLEGLTVNGMVKFNNATGIVIKGCTVNTDHSGIVSMSNGVSNAYIADNIVLGPTGWSSATAGSSGNNVGEGIQLTGPGNVICYNFVKGFRDAISTMEDSGAHNQVSIDIYNNDVEIGADDAIEADFTMGNCRVLRNRISNSFVGISSQPSLGGPAYFIRNVMYNLSYTPFKLQRNSVGDVAYHNTVVKSGDGVRVYTSATWSRAVFRNNIFIGGEGSGPNGGNGRVAYLLSADDTCDFNYDGFGSIGTGRFDGQIGYNRFSSLEELKANTTETNAFAVDLDIFKNTVNFPSSGPFPERSIPDLSLQADGAAVDKGVVLANVNDNYTGSAPDLGAYEFGEPLPHYGPRQSDNLAVVVPIGAIITLILTP